MLKTDLDRKIFMAENFLDSAQLLEGTTNVVIANAQKEAVEKSEDIPLKRKVVTHFLYGMVIEISIKIIWEIEHGKTPPYDHDILSRYNELSQNSQQEISNIYNIQVANMKKLISECNGRKNRGGQIVNLNLDLQSLEEALKVNEQTVKNFKYDGKFGEKSSALCSIMNIDDLIYILPRSIVNAIIFPKLLLDYAISLRN